MNNRNNNIQLIHSTAEEPTGDPVLGYRETCTIDFSRYNFSLDTVLIVLFQLPSDIQEIVRSNSCSYAWVSRDWAEAFHYDQPEPPLCVKQCPKINFIESEPERRIYPFVFASQRWWDELRMRISRN